VSKTSRETVGSSAAIKSECGFGFSRCCDWLAAQSRSGAGGNAGAVSGRTLLRVGERLKFAFEGKRINFAFQVFVIKALQILVADDDATMRQSIKQLLEHDGHEVCPVDSSEAALARLAERKFDLVITDFLMPGIHGDELVAHIRKLIPTQRILMVTAFLNEYEKYGQAADGINGLLLKPFSRQALQEAVAKVLTHEQPDQTRDKQPVEEP